MLKSYQKYYWGIWESINEDLEKYALYTTKNIRQLKKSLDDLKLDRDLEKAAKNI